ncbi:MAG: hypothetical protein KKD69_08950 [Euryarchaeota archaeon]|nr:hypothetical protein [Euryarchaeota archaeon]MBU4492574.1 hypothetical protein [Euryarchaeota archaeon]
MGNSALGWFFLALLIVGFGLFVINESNETKLERQMLDSVADDRSDLLLGYEREYLQSGITALESRIENLESENSDLESRMNDVQDENSRLESQVSDIESQINDLESRIADLESQLS